MDTIETISGAGHPARTERFAVRPSGQRAYVGRLVRMARSLAVWIDRLIERRRSRLALLEMNDSQLKDIGISRCDAYREGLRPFWN
jgi:uncharacterized protein YjiS (DUF1127 family)